MSREAFVNASPLIILASVGRLDFLRLAGDTLTIPGQVMTELRVKGASDPVMLAIFSATYLKLGADAVISEDLGSLRIGPGELSVLAQSRTSKATAVLDDLQARRVATRLGIPVVGTLGLIARAKSAGIIVSARPEIEAIARSGMFLSRRVIEDLLRRLGE